MPTRRGLGTARAATRPVCGHRVATCGRYTAQQVNPRTALRRARTDRAQRCGSNVTAGTGQLHGTQHRTSARARRGRRASLQIGANRNDNERPRKASLLPGATLRRVQSSHDSATKAQPWHRGCESWTLFTKLPAPCPFPGAPGAVRAIAGAIGRRGLSPPEAFRTRRHRRSYCPLHTPQKASVIWPTNMIAQRPPRRPSMPT